MNMGHPSMSVQDFKVLFQVKAKYQEIACPNMLPLEVRLALAVHHSKSNFGRLPLCQAIFASCIHAEDHASKWEINMLECSIL